MNIYIAAIDVGSNAVRMVLSRCQQTAQEQSHLRLIQSWRSFLRLGEDVFNFGQISQTHLEALTDILKQFVNELQHYANVSLCVAATSAVRAAKNKQEVLQYVQKNAGIEIKILSGMEEADCMLNALQNMTTWQSIETEFERVLLTDLGGGSLEVSVVEASRILYRKSLDYGALRLAKMNSNAQQIALNALNREIQEMGAFAAASQNDIPSHFVLTGGSAKVMARLVHERLYPAQQLPTLCTFSWEHFTETKFAIFKLGVDHYIASSEIRPEQAELLIPALLVFEMLGSIIRCQKFSIPFISLKEGLLLQHAQRIFPQCKLLL